MKRELLPLRKIVSIGFWGGLFIAGSTALYCFYIDDPISLGHFIFLFLGNGLWLSLAFRYKYTKNTIEE
ncbi:hypothetical protein [Mangrovimonas sp. TPBH4]|uniref:hypothetical protein n=1 Tax=Mangrovimonas sp. TPBH4 TaxID=1645914 RepID=UPI0012FC2410|nr:hypothetical protein [Mangrovimonas sp. TPBH4]